MALAMEAVVEHFRRLIRRVVTILTPLRAEWVSTDDFVIAWTLATDEPLPGLLEQDGLDFFLRLQKALVVVLYWVSPVRVLLRLHPSIVRFLDAPDGTPQVTPDDPERAPSDTYWPRN